MKVPLSKIEVRVFQPQPVEDDTDIVAICPDAPEFFVAGTYSLLKKSDVSDYPGQVRHGTIRVCSVNPYFRPTFPGQQLPILAKHKFSAAVLDIHFHPKDLSLLGVALSNTEVHFFRFVKRAAILDRRTITELLPIGHVKITGKDQYGLIPLVTQFHWLNMYIECGSPRESTNTITACFAATTSAYEVFTVKVKIPGIKSTFDHRLAHKRKPLDSSAELIHTHENEAWTVSSIPTSTQPEAITTVLLSGADDCKLLTATSHIDSSSHAEEHSIAPTLPLWTDSKSHSYGVTAILPLAPPLPLQSSENPPPIPLLTGSYDENLRLFTLNPHTHRREPLQPRAELELRGGVWRIKLMDHYIVRTAPSHPITNTFHTTIPPHETHYIVLLSTMHAGAQIVRLVHDPTSTSPWSLTLVAHFIKGHESLVYTADSHRDWDSPYNTPRSSVADDHCDSTWPEGVAEIVKDLLDPNKIRVDIAWAPPRVRPYWVVDPTRRQHPTDANIMLAENMGYDKGSWKRTLRFENKMRYEGRIGSHTIVSVGFYDRLLCTWSWTDGQRRDGLDLLEFLDGGVGDGTGTPSRLSGAL